MTGQLQFHRLESIDNPVREGKLVQVHRKPILAGGSGPCKNKDTWSARARPASDLISDNGSIRENYFHIS